jgi:hypothetical protein
LREFGAFVDGAGGSSGVEDRLSKGLTGSDARGREFTALRVESKERAQDVSQPRWILSYLLKILCHFTATRDTYFRTREWCATNAVKGRDIGRSVNG